MKQNTIKQIVIWGVYLAVFLIFGLTPLGYPSIGIVNLTLIPLLIIIITMHMGLSGLAFGFIFFGLSSFIKQFIMVDPFGSAIVSSYSLGTWFVISFVSRFCLGLFVFIGYFLLRKTSFFIKFSFVIFATIIGNTFFFLSTVSFYGYKSRTLWIWFTLIVPNLVVEWVVLPIICFSLSFFIIYLRKTFDQKNNW